MSFRFLKHLESKPFIETACRIYFKDLERYRLFSGFDQFSYQVCADAAVLKLGKEVDRNKKCLVPFFVDPEQPASTLTTVMIVPFTLSSNCLRKSVLCHSSSQPQVF
jgi:hypothetical protein